jgi:hypothetical protein
LNTGILFQDREGEVIASNQKAAEIFQGEWMYFSGDDPFFSMSIVNEVSRNVFKNK